MLVPSKFVFEENNGFSQNPYLEREQMVSSNVHKNAFFGTNANVHTGFDFDETVSILLIFLILREL